MSVEVPEILLSHYLKTLKLPTFQREYQKLARLCATEGVDHVGYVSFRFCGTGWPFSQLASVNRDLIFSLAKI